MRFERRMRGHRAELDALIAFVFELVQGRVKADRIALERAASEGRTVERKSHSTNQSRNHESTKTRNGIQRVFRVFTLSCFRDSLDSFSHSIHVHCARR